jgi:hypothetical protein
VKQPRGAEKLAMSLVVPFTELVQQVACSMTAPSLATFLTLVTGWVFAPRRTVTAMIVAAQAVGRKHHSAYHRLFAKARWSLDELGLALFARAQPWVEGEVVKLTLDDTLARKRGLKVFGAGMHHDPLQSTRKLAVLSWGHSWVVLAVVVRLPWCPHRVFSLPILVRLYLTRKTAAAWGLAYRTRPQLAVELLERLCRAQPQRRFHLVADSAYGGQSVLGSLPLNCDLTSRMPLNARLYDPPPSRKPGTNGRPRKRGAQQPTPEQRLQQRGRRISLDLYGRRDRVRVVETEARWHSVPDRPLKVVAVEPLIGGRPTQAFYSTRVEQTAEQVLADYANRWSIEEAFQGSKTHLGFEQPQSWTRKAVRRTAPMALLLYSLIVLWFAREGHDYYLVPNRPWYRTKTQPSFADMLATLKCESLKAEVSKHLGNRRLPRNLENALMSAIRAGP